MIPTVNVGLTCHGCRTMSASCSQTRKVVTSHIVLTYSMLTNSWSPGLSMTSPRCLFGSVSLGEKAVIAGRTDARGNILSSAELYNSELQAWVTLPTMNRSRKMCSGEFMDKKFYDRRDGEQHRGVYLYEARKN